MTRIDETFLPIARRLVVRFGTPIEYTSAGVASYDPATGAVSQAQTTLTLDAGITRRRRLEEGGPGERQELELWIHHDADGLPTQARTDDVIAYDGIAWRVVKVDPGYSSGGLIASRILARSA